jgi:hypothetical protein
MKPTTGRKTGLFFIFCSIFVLLLIFFHMPNSIAAVITYDYTGIHPDGSTISGLFNYDTDTADQYPTGDYGIYITGFFNGAISGGSNDGVTFEYFSGTNAGDIIIRTVYRQDTYTESFFQIWKWIDASIRSSLLSLHDETVPLARTDDLLPNDLNLADYGFAKLWVDLPSGIRMAYDITSITKRAESVPEPSTILLLGAGLAGVGLFRRRFKN